MVDTGFQGRGAPVSESGVPSVNWAQSSVAGGLPATLRVEADGGQTLGVYASWRSALIRAPSNTDGSSIMISYSSSSSSRSIPVVKYSALLARRGYVCPIRDKLRELPARSRKLRLVCSLMSLRAMSLLRLRRSASSCGVASIKRNENHSHRRPYLDQYINERSSE